MVGRGVLQHFRKLQKTIGTLDTVSQSPNHKEETMKKFISITVAFMLMLIFIGCSATKTSEQRKELYEERDLRRSVGNKPFVGQGGVDSRGMMYMPISSN
jgi:hypothetical protein